MSAQLDGSGTAGGATAVTLANKSAVAVAFSRT